MNSAFLEEIDSTWQKATSSGELKLVDVDQVFIVQNDIPFVVQCARRTNEKDPAVLTDSNTLLEASRVLIVGKVGNHHDALLSPSPICNGHLLLLRSEPMHQRTPLGYEDFLALALMISEARGLGFYDGGTQAGANYLHKHMHWIPSTKNNPNLNYLNRILGVSTSTYKVETLAGFAMPHAAVRVNFSVDSDEYARSIFLAYNVACQWLQHTTDDSGLMPPANLLVDSHWLLMVPRTEPHFQGISVNAFSFGGLLYVDRPAHAELITQVGPLSLLAAVCT